MFFEQVCEVDCEERLKRLHSQELLNEDQSWAAPDWVNFSVLFSIYFKAQVVACQWGLFLDPVPTKFPVDCVLQSSVIVVVLEQVFAAVVTEHSWLES